MLMTFNEYLKDNYIDITQMDADTLLGLLEDWIQYLLKCALGAPKRVQHSYAQHILYLQVSCTSTIKAFGQLPTQMQAGKYGSLVSIIDSDFGVTLARMTPCPLAMPAKSEFYPHSGIAFMGYYVCDTVDNLTAWAKKTCYNSVHPSGDEKDYVSKKGGSPWVVKGSPNMSHAKAIGKPDKPEALLGKGRHAEDGWFAYHLDTFLGEVIKYCTKKPLTKGPTLLHEMLFSVPRLEFIDTCIPCQEDGNDKCSGCRKYFTYLRKLLINSMANGAQIPILIFAFKPYENGGENFELYYVDANGALKRAELNWKPM